MRCLQKYIFEDTTFLYTPALECNLNEIFLQTHQIQYIFGGPSSTLLWCILYTGDWNDTALLYTAYEGDRGITTLVWKMCENIVTPPSHFDHLPTQVQKSPYWLQGSESLFFICLAPTELFVWKNTFFYPFWKFTLKYNIICFHTFGLFGTLHYKIGPSFLWATNL